MIALFITSSINLLIIQLALQSKIDLFDCKCYFIRQIFFFRFAASLRELFHRCVESKSLRYVFASVRRMKSNFIEFLLLFELFFFFFIFLFTFVVSFWSHFFDIKQLFSILFFFAIVLLHFWFTSCFRIVHYCYIFLICISFRFSMTVKTYQLI